MTLSKRLRTAPVLLMEGALGERLKREYHLTPDPHVALAALARTPAGADALRALWREYAGIARRYRLPLLTAAPTRRANRDRILAAGLDERLLFDNVALLKALRQESGIEMYVGGLMGCRGDAYTGEGALSASEARRFHLWQAKWLADAGADYLYAGIMPTLPEAVGMAQAMASTGLDYIVSFTIQADGRLIDGTAISDAILSIDRAVNPRPLCYMTNCVHPSIARRALGRPFNALPVVRERFLGIQANTSPLSYAELDGAAELHASEPNAFAREMLALKSAFGLRILGGCCGTDHRHMEAVARLLRPEDPVT